MGKLMLGIIITLSFPLVVVAVYIVVVLIIINRKKDPGLRW